MVDEGDRLLPIANVGRIMKNTLPPTAKISKGSKETMQECVTEFISFVTGEASDKCHKENRKTVNGDDIVWALSTLGFDNYAEVITRYLHKYRESELEKANNNCHGKDGGSSSSNNEEGDIRRYKNLMETSTSSMPLEFRIMDPKGKNSFN
ncbi:nuclear transcription factor Y subunit B-4-like [Silene latifolia]|uniref:nuclear transcription factor Y subunit B-4-like n=1 Tax=Silene latifolia TaxID=37657 RepID=UPI003D781559